jgi:hypothetical protein
MTFTLGVKETGTEETDSIKRDPIVDTGQIISVHLIRVLCVLGWKTA